MRLIDADALANYANNQIAGITANHIMRFPTVDAEPIKHGHWEKEEDFIGEKYRCTMCKNVIRYDREYVCQGELIFDFCPFCGADMRGEEHEQS